jgi:hypothetical protein
VFSTEKGRGVEEWAEIKVVEELVVILLKGKELG